MNTTKRSLLIPLSLILKTKKNCQDILKKSNIPTSSEINR